MVKLSKKVGIITPLAYPMGIIPKHFAQSYMANYAYLIEHQDELPFKISELREIQRENVPISANRNESVAWIKKYDLDITVWFDADQELVNYGTGDKKPDILFRLLRDGYDYPIYAGIYYLKKPPYMPVIMTSDKKFQIFHSIVKIPDKLFYADMIGMGCVKIDRKVFNAINAPGEKYFRYQEVPKTFITKNELVRFKYEHKIDDVSEDKQFFKLVKQQTKYRPVIDPKIQVGHVTINVVTPKIFEAFRDFNLQSIREEKGDEEFNKWWEIFEEPELV